MKKKPLVSIIIPVYNGSDFMREAIDSALSQTYKNTEIIVINDGSNDGGKTSEIAKSYGDKIRYYEKENGGVSTALNLGIKKMKGDFFSWLSHDDVYPHEKIETQINYLIANNLLDEKTILYSNYYVIDKKSRVIFKEIKNHKMLNEKPEYAILRISIDGTTLLIPKKAFKEHGNFDENLRCVQDYKLWLKMSKTYRFYHMEEFLSKSRMHGNQVSVNSTLVLSEGEPFWINAISSISKNRMIKLEGSEFNYYKEMAKYLRSTPYEKALDFCKNKYRELKGEPLELENIRDNENLFKKLFKYIRVFGFGVAIKKTITKMKRSILRK